MIDPELLVRYGATERLYNKRDMLFLQGEPAYYYFQIASGEIKMNNYNDEGREFVQGIFSEGRSFGEPPLFTDSLYPANAMAIEKSRVFCLPKSQFFQLLQQHPAVHLEVTKVLASRLEYKATIASNISIEDADHRVLTLIDYLKHTIYELPEPFTYEVELTRQQIADLTGLRVETVIRTVKRLEKQEAIRLQGRKVWR